MMIAIVVASNIGVQYPINDWLTWGALSYPMSFLVTEIVNRLHGPMPARRVVYAGFAVGVLLSFVLSTPRIAFASGTAFLISQLLDIAVFNRLRSLSWWYAPFFASVGASIIDTALFWSIAFYGEPMPLLTLATGDFLIKLVLDVGMLLPFRLAIAKTLKRNTKLPLPKSS